MQNIPFTGIVVAAVAVLAAYWMGYVNGIAMGREEGYDNGKKEGSREGSIHAYAVGFDRGKRARDDEDEEVDDEGEEVEGGGRVGSNLGLAIVGVAAGLFAVLWLSSQTPTTPIQDSGKPARTPMVEAVDIQDVARLPHNTAPNPDPLPTASVTLPRVNRTLTTTSPVPTNGPVRQYRAAESTERGAVEFPHPPPKFGESGSEPL